MYSGMFVAWLGQQKAYSTSDEHRVTLPVDSVLVAILLILIFKNYYERQKMVFSISGNDWGITLTDFTRFDNCIRYKSVKHEIESTLLSQHVSEWYYDAFQQQCRRSFRIKIRHQISFILIDAVSSSSRSITGVPWGSRLNWCL